MKYSRALLAACTISLLTPFALLRAEDKPSSPPPPPPPAAEKGERKGPRGGRFSPEQQLQMMDEQLTLTADQKAKIKTILEQTAEKAQALSPEERREKGMELRQSANKEIRALLTADQQTKFDEMMARRGRGPGGPREKGEKSEKKSE